MIGESFFIFEIEWDLNILETADIFPLRKNGQRQKGNKKTTQNEFTG